MKRQYDRLRKQIFSMPIPFDSELLATVDGFSSHGFLQNPAGQNIYLYLTAFVKELSERYCDRPISEIKILDWGCGKGHVTYLLNKLGAKTICCDLQSSSNDSSFGQETPILDEHNIVVQPLDGEYELPYDDESMDVVLSFGVLEHVNNDFRSLQEINRILQPGGLLFCFNLPYIFSYTQNLAHLRGNYYHDRLYSKSQVTKLLTKSNFEILDLWHRQLLPKNSIKYPKYQLFESIDQFFTEHTPLKYLATNIEFVATACK